MADKSVDEEIKIKAQQARRLARYMSSTEDLVETKFRGPARREIDNLPGRATLKLEENPLSQLMRMAFKILKDNDFAPRWIELQRTDADLRSFGQRLIILDAILNDDRAFRKPPLGEGTSKKESLL